jgi:hypothetical protein
MIKPKSSGLMLAPPSAVPNLAGLSREEQIDAMVTWFGENFEDPSAHTPRDDGEFVYVWGGPHDARDELNDAFAGIASDDEIVEAVDRVEEEALDWAPNERRLVEEEDDDLVVWEEAPIPPEAKEKAEAVRRGLDELETLVREWKNERPQIGHNRPPGPIDDELPDAVFDDIETGITEARGELDKPVPDTAALKVNEGRFRRIQQTIKDWMKKAAYGGLAAAGGYVGDKILDRIWEHLGTVSESISALIAVLPGF